MNLVPPSVLTPGQQGVQVEYPDWNAMVAYILQTAGYAIAFGQGTINGVPQFQALNCVPVSGMIISLGGTSSNPQWAMIAGILAAALAAQQYTVPNNSSGQT